MSKIKWILSERNEGDLKNMQDEMNRLTDLYKSEEKPEKCKDKQSKESTLDIRGLI